MTASVDRSFIHRFLAAVLLLLALSAPARAQTILIVGDSLSAAYNIDRDAGWVELLQRRLSSRKSAYQVINASISGDTTAGGAARLPKLLSQHRPNVVIVELGGNDGLRGLPPEQTKRNLTTMVARAQSTGAKVLVLGIRLPPNYGTRYNQRFQQLYRDLARENQVPLVPFVLEGIATDTSLMQSDRIHPNERAQPRILENVWRELQPLL